MSTSGPTSTPASTRPKKPTRAILRRRGIRRVRLARHLTQAFFVGLVLFVAIRHGTAEKGSETASVDAICPFGAVETLWTWATTGALISKIHPSNLILGLAVLLSVLVAGNAFCGWVCPFGALQDLLDRVARWLRLPRVAVPERLDRVLRWGRFVVLGVIVWMSATTLKLWFADYDPYATVFGLKWVFEPNLETMWPALVIVAVVLGLALLVERAWCRYLCPAGAVFKVLAPLSILRIRRTDATCTGCDLCKAPCPVGIDVGKARPAVSGDCVGCLDCVTTCPVGGALGVTARAPLADLFARDHTHAVPHPGRRGPVPVTIGRRPTGKES